MGDIIDVEFGDPARGRWCGACDEFYPEGTAVCPRCGGSLESAAVHLAERTARTRRAARLTAALMWTGALLLLGLFLWLALR